MGQNSNHIKMNLDYIQIQKWMLQKLRSQKVDEKKGSFVEFPIFLPELWSLNCPKSAFFAILCWLQQGT